MSFAPPCDTDDALLHASHPRKSSEGDLGSNAAAQEALREFLEEKTITREVVSDSMDPTLRPGDRIRIVPSCNCPRVGEIWAFWGPDKQVLIVHRVIASKIQGQCLMTKGDNRWRPDGWIPRQAFFGKVTHRHREEGDEKRHWKDFESSDRLKRAMGVLQGTLGAFKSLIHSMGRRLWRSKTHQK